MSPQTLWLWHARNPTCRKALFYRNATGEEDFDAKTTLFLLFPLRPSSSNVRSGTVSESHLRGCCYFRGIPLLKSGVSACRRRVTLFALVYLQVLCDH